MALSKKIDPNELPTQAQLENNMAWAEEKVNAVSRILHELEYWTFSCAAYGRDSTLERKLIEELNQFLKDADNEYLDAQSSYRGYPETFDPKFRDGQYYFDLAKKLTFERAEELKKK